MIKRFVSVCLLALVFVSGIVSLSRVTAISPEPHAENCGSCHLAGEQVTQENAHQLHRSQEVLCGACHQNALRMSHATGFAPGRVLPVEYPLDWKGDVTCSTCHDLHSGKPGLLRGEKRGRAFCHSCHSESFFAGMPDAGTSIVSGGHLDARNSMDNEGLVQYLTLDQFSIQCLSCHGEKTEGAPPVGIDTLGIVRHAGNSVNHPVGKDYDTAARFGGYRPKSQLSKTVYLPEGRVGCISCHQGYTSKHGALVKSNRGSQLCFECHDL